MAQRYDRNVRAKEFGARDLVLRRVVEITKDLNAGKLAPNWKGPYKFTAIARAGAYYLEDMEERPLP